MKKHTKSFGSQSRILCAIALVAVIGLLMAACKEPTDSGITPPVGIPTPVRNVTALSGVTATNDIIEIVNTTVNQGRAIVATGWNNGDSYKAFVNGVEKSAGTVTVSGGSITAFIKTSGLEITVTTNMITIDSKSAQMSATEDDMYYCIGASTPYKTSSQITSITSGKTAEGALNLALNGTLVTYGYAVRSGNWDAMKAFGKENRCPDSVVTSTANTLNKAVSGWGYYTDISSGFITVFFITRSSAIQLAFSTP